MNRIHLPPQALRHELPRSQMLERLATATDYRLIALIAPSGYGKTTLLAQFARSTPYPVVWLSLREDDADPHVLSASLREAVAQTLGPLEPEPGGSGQPGSSLRGLAGQLNYLPYSVRIVLDGLQCLGADAGRELDRFIAALNEGHQVLVSSFLDPPLRLAHALARGAALILGLTELAFSCQESELYLRARHFQGRADAAYAHLCGWPVGLALISSEASLHYQPEHLISEMIDTLPAEIAGTLCEAAVMETWEEPLAQTLGLRVPPGWLEQVKKLGLPLTPLGTGRYAPHQLLLETLTARLKLHPERTQALHARMAEVCLAEGNALAALRHLHHAQHTGEALELAERLATTYSDRLEMALVCRVLEEFRPEQLSPRLQLHWAGALLETGQREAGLRLLERVGQVGESATYHFYAARRFGAEGDFAAQLAQATAALERYPNDVPLLRVRAHALLNLGSPAEALEVSQFALGLARAAAESSSPQVEEAQCLHLCAQCLYGLGRWQEYQSALEQALGCFEALSMPLRGLYLSNDLADLYRKQGKLEQAHTLLERAIRLAREENSPTLPLLLETLGETQLDAGNREGGLESLRLALALCAEYGALNLQNRIRVILAEALARLDLSAQAEAQLEAVGDRDPALQPRIALVRGLLALVRGQDQEALRHLQPLRFEAHHPLALRVEVYRRELGLRLKQRSRRSVQADEWLRQHPARHVLKQDAPWVSRTLRELKLHFDALRSPHIHLLRLETLGSLRAWVEEAALHIPFAKAGELLVWLALFGPARRERIIDALWDGSAEERHIGYFKVAARRLRLSLSEAFPEVVNPLPFEQGVYALSPEIGLSVDLRWQPDPALEPPEQLAAFLEVWKGDFLPGVGSGWVELEREQARDRASAELHRLAAALAATHPELAGQALEHLLLWDPLDHSAHLALIRLHHQHHDRVRSQQAYSRYARMMEQELGEAPEPYAAVLEGDSVT